MLPTLSLLLYAMTMKAAGFSETLVKFYQTTWHHNIGDNSLYGGAVG
jgi:hypothetical protein